MITYSVVICVQNQKAILQSALESLKRQIRNPKIFEIVIADDGSTDGTDDFVKNLRYPIFLKYMHSAAIQGRAQNRNKGFRKSAGEWAIFIDGDMVPSTGFVEAYLGAWHEFPNAVIIGSWSLPATLIQEPYLKYLATRGRLIMARGQQVPGKYFTSGNFAIRRDLLELLGGFDTGYPGWGGEDTDFGFQLEEKGIPIIYIPEASCGHFHRKSLDEVILEYLKFGQYGYPRLVEKYPDKVILEKGWRFGLPGSHHSISKNLMGLLLWPCRSRPVLSALKRLAVFRQGKLFSEFMYDWLFYGHLARGYKGRQK